VYGGGIALAAVLELASKIDAEIPKKHNGNEGLENYRHDGNLHGERMKFYARNELSQQRVAETRRGAGTACADRAREGSTRNASIEAFTQGC
jgi:hypothetical protein